MVIKQYRLLRLVDGGVPSFGVSAVARTTFVGKSDDPQDECGTRLSPVEVVRQRPVVMANAHWGFLSLYSLGRLDCRSMLIDAK